MSGTNASGQRTTDLLAIALENVELRQQLAEVQDQCIELALDAGGLHTEIKALIVHPAGGNDGDKLAKNEPLF